ncbi:hypothetical protein [Muricoccus radiodurans]|uniref:hypothetical protein n=1 Tax=Muricoccus radiodurans TaxID=2231721 RepID=UPI003CEEEE61
MPANLIPFPPIRQRRRPVEKVVLPRWNGWTRIRRTDALIGSFETELRNAYHRAYPQRLVVGPKDAPICYLAYHLSPKSWLTENEVVAHRRLMGWIEQNGDRVGAIHLDEWHPVPGIDNDSFLEEMDTWSQASYDLGVALSETWDMEELSEAGPILDFHLLWMHPAYAKASLWRDVIQELIRRRYAKQFSVLVQQVFPLEYEGAGDACIGRGSPFERRRRAMVRLSQRTLGVMPFPGEPANDGWMWKPLSHEAPKPKARGEQGS